MKTIKNTLTHSLYILLATGIFSCTSSDSNNISRTPTESYYEYNGGVWSSMEYGIDEKTIDECEYIIIFGSQGRNIIHKANCGNSFHTGR